MSRVGLLSLGDLVGDPVTGRSPSRAERHRSVVEAAVVAEAAGFDLVAVGEHHFCGYVVSSPPVVLAAIAERTRRIRLGTGVALLATLDPLRVAEDYATLDLVSGGRVELTTGRGILRNAYEAFGPDIAESRGVYADKLERLLAAWRGEPDAAGLVVEPQLASLPPVWVGGGSSTDSIDLAARLGCGLMLPSVVAPVEAFVPLVERYRARYADAGHVAPARVGAVNHSWVATRSQDALARFRPRYAATPASSTRCSTTATSSATATDGAASSTSTCCCARPPSAVARRRWGSGWPRCGPCSASTSTC